MDIHNVIVSMLFAVHRLAVADYIAGQLPRAGLVLATPDGWRIQCRP